MVFQNGVKSIIQAAAYNVARARHFTVLAVKTCFLAWPFLACSGFRRKGHKQLICPGQTKREDME